jgi:hypothetical protein
MFTRTLHFLWQPQRRLASHLALLATLVIAGPMRFPRNRGGISYKE